jgi:hypothetical protein
VTVFDEATGNPTDCGITATAYAFPRIALLFKHPIARIRGPSGHSYYPGSEQPRAIRDAIQIDDEPRNAEIQQRSKCTYRRQPGDQSWKEEARLMMQEREYTAVSAHLDRIETVFNEQQRHAFLGEPEVVVRQLVAATQVGHR